MKVALFALGYPPHDTGELERSTRALAHGLCAAKCEVLVVAGSSRRSERANGIEHDEEHDGGVRVLRLRRDDLFIDHWHKTLAPAATRAIRGVLREFAPDVVHVLHWQRLSRDLVLSAAREGVPAVVSLNDAWLSCPITTRVHTGSGLPCAALVGPMPCIACAGRTAPRTPWVTQEQAFMALAERQRDLLRELQLARVLITPSAAHGRTLERQLGLVADTLSAELVPPMRTCRFTQRAPIASFDDVKPLILGAWGTIAPHRGQDLIIDAIARTNAPRRFQLRIAGHVADASYSRDLRERSRDLAVEFQPEFECAELDTHAVGKVHAMVSGTRAHEAYGVELDEARELGLVALVPDTPVFAERRSIDARGVTLYEQGSVIALASALQLLLSDPTAWRAATLDARAAALATPQPPDFVQVHLALYERALALGAPNVAEAAWFEARLHEESVRSWDNSASSATRCGLGDDSNA